MSKTCSSEEIQEIMSQYTAQLRLEISDLEKRQDEKLEKSHMAVAQSVSGFGNDLKALRTEIKSIVDLYNGVSTVKSFIVGLASLIIAISAVGAGVIWIIKSVK